MFDTREDINALYYNIDRINELNLSSKQAYGDVNSFLDSFEIYNGRNIIINDINLISNRKYEIRLDNVKINIYGSDFKKILNLQDNYINIRYTLNNTFEYIKIQDNLFRIYLDDSNENYIEIKIN